MNTFFQGEVLKRIKPESSGVPILSWCTGAEDMTMDQARNLTRHSRVFHHVALMPDCHPGYGMPIGGVIACPGAVIPYAVGVDIGCGMVAVKTAVAAEELSRNTLEILVKELEKRVPTGRGHSHRSAQEWDGFGRIPSWMKSRGRELAVKSLGTLGGGNHFMEVQSGEDGFAWLMVHSGSRNTGYRIARHHHEIAVEECRRRSEVLPAEELSFLLTDSGEGRDYVEEMEFAMDYARENRRRLMKAFQEVFTHVTGRGEFTGNVNIHHNYAAEEEHFGEKVWVHRKGATSAKKGELGIIPGSMGTCSYIVEGLGCPDSFHSCSHGAGRVMGRRAASRELDPEECDRAMKGIVFSGWKKYRGYRRKKKAPELDLSEAPAAYKDIGKVMEAQKDLARPVVRLRPLAVVKG